MIILAFLLGSCATASPSATSIANKPTLTVVPSPTATSLPQQVYINPLIQNLIDPSIQLPGDWDLTTEKEQASYWIDLNLGKSIGSIVLALVAPFPTIRYIASDGV
jgi:hypothetical protein